MAQQLRKLYVGDYGFTIRLRMVKRGVAQNISSYTTLTFIFRKPDGTSDERTASFAAGGTDGKLSYVVEDDLLDTPGTWRVQARVAKTGALITSDDLRFDVLEPFA